LVSLGAHRISRKKRGLIPHLHRTLLLNSQWLRRLQQVIVRNGKPNTISGIVEGAIAAEPNGAS
jgi:hypothetical protein